MIQANELRIGNLILNNDGQTTKVSLLCGNLISVSDSNSVNEKAAKAIPLTEEWLLNFGFTYPRKASSVLMLAIAYYDGNSPCTLQVSGSGIQVCRSGIGAMCAPVFYVHQLQNLYFALTGSELVLKPIVPEAT